MDFLDYLLLLIGIVVVLVYGVVMFMIFFFFGDFIDGFGINLDNFIKIVEDVNKVSINYLYLN